MPGACYCMLPTDMKRTVEQGPILGCIMIEIVLSKYILILITFQQRRKTVQLHLKYSSHPLQVRIAHETMYIHDYILTLIGKCSKPKYLVLKVAQFFCLCRHVILYESYIKADTLAFDTHRWEQPFSHL